ncbi:Thiol-disulfide isomerase or thioredoxin [Parapedobacter composti]|uniref:Thiol-disulfide isomerase or thioredoxin n=1 Tax=Parapedobacter composti TaxID=623281 RepID=A0A1I1MG90_9SPHI|nr:TlpA disulfide reductase family protein [Parapedobacter composti]SFC84156.1 Thiol-disulfide isomerase or thioredoxin [Parapedobacter composti]
MKRILRIGEGYALSKRYSSLLAAVTIMCLYAVKQASAQEAEPAATAVADIIPLKIGDSIPGYLWHMPLQVVNHPEGKEAITLNDYRCKLIILDFWATWCSSCIAAMPRIHRLEKEHAGEMAVIPVTYETADKVVPFLSSNKTMQPLGVYSVVADELLKAAFPHRGVPHYVWISPAGSVGAITTSERVTAENIRQLLDGDNIGIPVKNDIDPERPLFLSDAIQLDDLTHYSVFTKGKYDGLPSGNRFRKENGVVRGRALTNTSMLGIYKTVAYHLFERNGERFYEKRLLVEPEGSKGAMRMTDGLYNYELIVPVRKADSLYDYMLADLNRYTGLKGRIEKRKIKCLVLKAMGGGLDGIKTKGGPPVISLFSARTKSSVFTNSPIKYFVSRLNDNRDVPFLVIDETGYAGNVDLELPGTPDLSAIRMELERQNLRLEEDYRWLNMFILESNPV